MRILVITQWRPKRGGIVTHVENMMRHSKHEFTILTYPKFVDLPIIRAVSLILYGFLKGLFLDYDVIHAHYAAPQGFLGVLLKKVKGKPLVITAHGSDITVLGRSGLTRKLVSSILINADEVVAVSNFLKGEIMKMDIPEAKIRPIHNGLAIKQQLEPEVLSLHGDGPIITFIGGLVHQKGVDILLRSLVSVKVTKPDTQVIIIGQGKEEKKLKALAKELGLKDIHFLGERRDLITVMKESSVLVLPSREEGFGMVLLEAMDMGVPVVASDTGGIPEIVENMENGILVERENPEALGQGLITALTDKSLRDKIVKNGRKTVKKFRWENASSEVDLIYDKIAKRAHN